MARLFVVAAENLEDPFAGRRHSHHTVHVCLQRLLRQEYRRVAQPAFRLEAWCGKGFLTNACGAARQSLFNGRLMYEPRVAEPYPVDLGFAYAAVVDES